MKKCTHFAGLFIITMGLTGCVQHNKGCSYLLEDISNKPVIKAIYSSEVQIDGKLDDPVWQKADMYNLIMSREQAPDNQSPREAAEVQFGWDKKYLYAAITFEDSDILATGDKDNLHHYQLGDVCELFLKPLNRPYYWELYVTPRNKKTAFFFPMRGTRPIAIDESMCSSIHSAVRVKGSLNDNTKADGYWTAEIAIPRDQLEKYCDKTGTKYTWRVLVARYNYTHALSESDWIGTTFPGLSRTSFHLLEEYAVLTFVK